MQRENRQIVLLHKAAAADAHALYLIRYEAYLAQYGAYGSSDCPCVQSEEQFLEQIKQENTYRITAGGVTVGGLTMQPEEDDVLLKEIYVKPDWQQMGVAQVALMHAELRYPSARYRAQVISGEAAAQGLSRHNAYVRRNRAANALPNGQIYAAFVEEYPDVRPEDIPQQVWEWAQQEGSLVSAYRKWEIAELRDELAALEMNRRNRRAAVGTAQTDGEPAGIDPVTLALLGR